MVIQECEEKFYRLRLANLWIQLLILWFSAQMAKQLKSALKWRQDHIEAFGT